MKSLGIIIFDMDGTLVDSMQVYTDAFCLVLNRAHGVSHDISEMVFNDTGGLTLDYQFQMALERAKVIGEYDIRKLIDEFWEIVQKVDISLLPNAAQVIRQLARAGYILIISSGSTPSVISKRVEEANLKQSFRLLLGTDFNSKEMKKGEEHFKIIKRELSIPESTFRKKTLLVGDGLHDIEIAKQAGIKSIGMATNKNSERLRNAGKKEGIDFTIAPESQVLTPRGDIDPKIWTNNLILLGGPKRNIVTSEVLKGSPSLRYKMSLDEFGENRLYDSVTKNYLKSSRERSSNSIQIDNDNNDQSIGYDYSLVMSMPSPSHRENGILIIAGIHGPGTIGGSSYISERTNSSRLLRRRKGGVIQEVILTNYITKTDRVTDVSLV